MTEGEQNMEKKNDDNNNVEKKDTSRIVYRIVFVLMLIGLITLTVSIYLNKDQDKIGVDVPFYFAVILMGLMYEFSVTRAGWYTLIARLMLMVANFALFLSLMRILSEDVDNFAKELEKATAELWKKEGEKKSDKKDEEEDEDEDEDDSKKPGASGEKKSSISSKNSGDKKDSSIGSKSSPSTKPIGAKG
ncbi:hypothetical protein EDEG_03950 [Edhazardia aedis USNM 41457]|uniref:Uncharacterized protein n=1 Tax=Edhazardia aedis (strain USNM 41457) TaxID=1003232 RepID=J9DJA5_EDHAE|nr:hypothetical protein EDEG_03950 [Edhazardia aedis USNM 41457]|eukprot:EJW01462.1 hypothetical protein EDEG_03950 [Edhazardia aedis USNM 41457]